MKVIRFDEIDSTQKYAKELAKNGEIDFIVVAERQKAGNGRHGREWHSPKGGLWFSFVCPKPSDLPDEVFYLSTLAIGVCVKDILEEAYGCSLMIKWPNDILLNGKKVCGILCEKVGNKLICGIGINTNFIEEELGEYVATATSFFEETGIRIDNSKLVKQIFKGSREVIQELITKKEEVIEKMNESLAYKGEKRYLTYLKEEAKILGVDENGHLKVFANGEEKRVFAGEVL